MVILSANPNPSFHIRRHGSVRVLTAKDAKLNKKKNRVWERRRQKFGIGKTSGVTTRVISQTPFSSSKTASGYDSAATLSA